VNVTKSVRSAALRIRRSLYSWQCSANLTSYCVLDERLEHGAVIFAQREHSQQCEEESIPRGLFGALDQCRHLSPRPVPTLVSAPTTKPPRTVPPWGEVASARISADMSGRSEGWLRVQLESLDQWIVLVAKPRHFGGRQWYFICPVKNRPASVLWRPPAMVCIPASMGPAGCVPVAISGWHSSSASWKETDQVTADRQPRPRRMGFAAEAAMDAVEDLQSLRRKVRPVRGNSGLWVRSSGCQTTPIKNLLKSVGGFKLAKRFRFGGDLTIVPPEVSAVLSFRSAS
jgi:hypothetical protein